MKKTIIIALMAILPFGAFAQKFGHVNTSDIIPLMSEYKAAQAEMEELIKQYSEELDYMQSEYQKKYEDYAKNRETLPESIRTRREEEIMESRDKIQQYWVTPDGLLVTGKWVRTITQGFGENDVYTAIAENKTDTAETSVICLNSDIA